MWVTGADGCRGGWICASRNTETGELRFELVAAGAALLQLVPRSEVLCVDIPIGLPDRGARECDRLARKLLGWPRRSSVFPAPIRPALGATRREVASRITARADGRRVGAQAWALYAKIRDVDRLLREDPAARRWIHEVHPEVSFWAWNSEAPIQESKKTLAGRNDRLRLVERWLGPGVLDAARAGRPKQVLADDDILDAVAVLWTATRVANGSSRSLPEVPPTDAVGLRMEIVF